MVVIVHNVIKYTEYYVGFQYPKLIQVYHFKSNFPKNR